MIRRKIHIFFLLKLLFSILFANLIRKFFCNIQLVSEFSQSAFSKLIIVSFVTTEVCVQIPTKAYLWQKGASLTKLVYSGHIISFSMFASLWALIFFLLLLGYIIYHYRLMRRRTSKPFRTTLSSFTKSISWNDLLKSIRASALIATLGYIIILLINL